MKCFILCGGQGTRIRGVSDNLPKPMVPIGHMPILWHIMMSYSYYKVNQFVLCLGYRGIEIKSFFLNFGNQARDIDVDLKTSNVSYLDNEDSRIPDWKITLAETGENAMTGARVRRVRRYVEGEESFFLTYGDGLGNVDIQELLRFHESHGKILTVTGVRPPGRFGEIRADELGRVTEFNEKPQTTEGLISGGFFVCRQELFDYLPDREDLVFEQEPMKELARDGQLMVYRHEDFWQPMDTPRDYQYLNELWKRGMAPWKRW